jgi:hypothetical protein
VTTIASVGFLVAASSLLLPGWLIENLTQILTYPEYTQPGSPGAIFAVVIPGFGRQLGWVLTVIMAGFLVVEWISAWGKDFRWFLWAAYLTLVITNLIGVRTATENFIALLPGLILVFTTWDERWTAVGGSFGSAWRCCSSACGRCFNYLDSRTAACDPASNHVLSFPLFMMIGLYWVRWWSTPSRVYLDQLRHVQGLRLSSASPVQHPCVNAILRGAAQSSPSGSGPGCPGLAGAGNQPVLRGTQAIFSELARTLGRAMDRQPRLLPWSRLRVGWDVGC